MTEDAAPARPTVHVPVLLEEALQALDPRPGQAVVDATLGLGGHAAEILRRIGPGGRLIGLDLDPALLERARAKLAATGGDFIARHANFAGLPAVLAEIGLDRVDAIFADLGIASPHIDDPSRGFSFRQPGPLDMRLDPSRGQPASHHLHRMGLEELTRVLREFGDESDAARIARLIVRRRKESVLRTTEDLAAIVCEARRFTRRRAAGAKLHPATRTFQAIRMLVNREPANLERLLSVLPACLKPGGIAVLISFHSGEDRRVKTAFRAGLHEGIYAEISRRPVRPSPGECTRNPRSRSAKMRWARRSHLIQTAWRE